MGRWPRWELVVVRHSLELGLVVGPRLKTMELNYSSEKMTRKPLKKLGGKKFSYF